MGNVREVELITVWYNVSDGGDGSAYPNFYLTEEDTEKAVEKELEWGCGFGETCNGEIETYVGSSTYEEAVENSTLINKEG